MNNIAKSIFAGIGFVLLFLLIYLFLYRDHVAAPTTSDLNLNQEATKSASPDFSGKEEVLKDALNLFIQKKQSGLDMSSGPCLGSINADWVVDIAHAPRIPEDDKPQNVCQELLRGTATHFIELDPDGKLIRSE